MRGVVHRIASAFGCTHLFSTGTFGSSPCLFVDMTILTSSHPPVILFQKEDHPMSIYDYSAKTIDGEEKSLGDYKGKVLLIVNTASECGFTPQLEELQNLYEAYKDQGLEILGFPCNQFGKQDPGSDEEISQFCERNYGVTFPMFSKIDVKGENAHPLFVYLTKEAKGMLTKEIKWNFTKFLVDKEGEVIDRFAPQTKPESMKNVIEKQL